MDNFRDDGAWSDRAQLHELAQIGARSAALVHDVNNLLQIALGNLELIAHQPLEDATRKRLSRASASLSRCASMMSATLGSSDEAGDICVARFLADNIDSFRDVCGPGIQLDLKDRSNDAMIQADESRLEAALVNLLVNARDAMNGSGHVDIVCRLISNHRHQALQLCVVDDGPGIPPEIQEAVFSRFFTTKPTGSGIGLANVRAFVDASGGTVRLESLPERGTSVSMFFPVLPDTGMFAPRRHGYLRAPTEFHPPVTRKGILR